MAKSNLLASAFAALSIAVTSVGAAPAMAQQSDAQADISSSELDAFVVA